MTTRTRTDRRRASVEVRPRRTPEEVHRAAAERERQRSWAMVDAVLAQPCPRGHAPTGAWCWTDPARAVCGARVALVVRPPDEKEGQS